MGDSSELQIGDWVIAIGSPFELGNDRQCWDHQRPDQRGIGQGRGLEMQRGRLLQTDAAINPGNSGVRW
jgi:serine protease Do